MSEIRTCFRGSLQRRLSTQSVFGSHLINIFSLEPVPILDIHGVTLLNEFNINQDISLNMKITFSKLKLLLKGELNVIFYLDIDT